jgi:fluoride ion exporter CrcB/FEX
MSTWFWVLLACAGCYALKLAGYLVPLAWVEHPVVSRAMTAMTVGLLASLVTLNTVTADGRLVLDSRLLGLAAAVIALRLRAPYLVVVLVGAVATAVGRYAGLP